MQFIPVIDEKLKVNVINVNDLEPVITLSPVTGVLTIGEHESAAGDPPFALRILENTRAGVPLELLQQYDEDTARSDPTDWDIIGTGLHCELLNYQNHFRIVDQPVSARVPHEYSRSRRRAA